jgi:hypothetical protein
VEKGRRLALDRPPEHELGAQPAKLRKPIEPAVLAPASNPSSNARSIVASIWALGAIRAFTA